MVVISIEKFQYLFENIQRTYIQPTLEWPNTGLLGYNVTYVPQ